VFLQNVALWRESGYFDTSAALKPLLHLWSLAVEEQVYLVFPPLILLALRYRWPMVPLLVSLLVASLAACVVATRSAPSAAFFLTPFRVWEFLAGSILAWVHDKEGPPPARGWRRECASWCGLALLVFGLIWIREGEGFPGWLAAIPVAGTTLLLAAGTEATPNRWLLSLRPLVWIGLISYPLYLFHWPLLSFLHVVEGPKASPAHVAGAVALGFVLAVIAYVVLERTIRPSRWKGTVPALVAAFVALGAVGFALSRGLIPARPPSREAALVEEALAERVDYWKRWGDGYQRSGDGGINVWRTEGEGPKTLFVGDSTIGMIAPRVRELLPVDRPDARGAILVWAGAAFPIPGLSRASRPHQERLVPTFERVLEADPSIDRVMIGATWRSVFARSTEYRIEGDSPGGEPGRAKALTALGAMIGRLVQSGKQVFVILQVPSAEELDPGVMWTRSLLGGGSMRVRPLTVATFQERVGDFSLDDIGSVAAAAGAVVIDPTPALSRDGVYIAVDENGPVRTDGIHLRPRFSRLHATHVDPAVADVPVIVPWTRSDAAEGETQPARPLTWGVMTVGGSQATLATSDDGVMRVEIATMSPGPAWHVQLAGGSVPVEKGSRYTVSLRARSDAPRKVTLLAFQRSSGAPLGLVQDLDLDAKWQNFRFQFTATIDDEAARLRFNLNGSDIPVEVADVVFAPAR